MTIGANVDQVQDDFLFVKRDDFFVLILWFQNLLWSNSLIIYLYLWIAVPCVRF